MKNIFTKKSLLILGTAESVSGIGDWITMMAVLAMLVFRGGGGVAASSGIFLAGLVPTLIVSPLAGWLVDRVNRKTLLIGSQLLAGLMVSGLFFTTRLEVIYVILALEAVVISVVTPTRQAVIPDLVDRDDLTKANAFLQQLAGLVKVFSPVLAGLVLSVMDPHQAILFDVASFVLSAAVLTFLPSLPPHKASVTGEQAEEIKSLESGNPLAVMRSIPQIQILFITVFTAILGIIGFDVLSSIYTRDVLHDGEKLYGLIVSLVGIGSLVATAILMLRKKNGNPWKDMTIGFTLLGILPVAMVIGFQFNDINLAKTLLMAACFIGGIGNGLVHVQVGTIMQLVTPSNILGRVGGWLQTVMVGGQLVGLLVTPLLVPQYVSMQTFFAAMIVLIGLLVSYLCVFVLSKPGLNPAGANPEL
jgi:MFS family permease